ncbi:MAG: acyltransferase [Treponema sp.]|nr:acyltransferase [Treponema sp.]
MKNIVLPKIQKENGFTAIRLISAFIVVYEHFIILTEINLPILGVRGIAVNVFFILSGFWVTRSLYTSKSILEFYKKRIKKIFPAYLTVVFAAAIILVFMSTLTARQYFTDSGFWKYLAANISTLNFIHPSLPGVFNGEPVNGSLWTIKVELGFYIILPLIPFLCIGKKDNGGGYRCVVVLALIYLLSSLYVILIPYFVERYHFPSSIVNQLPAYMSYFSVGMFCFFFYEKLFSLWNKLIIPSAIILVLCIFLEYIWLTAFIEPLVLCFVVMWIALKSKPPFIFAKVYDFSYMLYLIHYPIIMVIKYLC